jgi:hypothetical protein
LRQDEDSTRALVAANRRTVWFTPLGNAKYLTPLGVARVHEMDWWEAAEVPAGPDGLQVVCLPAQHMTGAWAGSSALTPARARRLPHVRSCVLPCAARTVQGGCPSTWTTCRRCGRRLRLCPRSVPPPVCGDRREGDRCVFVWGAGAALLVRSTARVPRESARAWFRQSPLRRRPRGPACWSQSPASCVLEASSTSVCSSWATVGTEASTTRPRLGPSSLPTPPLRKSGTSWVRAFAPSTPYRRAHTHSHTHARTRARTHPCLHHYNFLPPPPPPPFPLALRPAPAPRASWLNLTHLLPPPHPTPPPHPQAPSTSAPLASGPTPRAGLCPMSTATRLTR